MAMFCFQRKRRKAGRRCNPVRRVKRSGGKHAEKTNALGCASHALVAPMTIGVQHVAFAVKKSPHEIVNYLRHAKRYLPRRYLKDQTGRCPVCIQFTLCVHDARLGSGQLTSAMQHLSNCTQRSGFVVRCAHDIDA